MVGLEKYQKDTLLQLHGMLPPQKLVVYCKNLSACWPKQFGIRKNADIVYVYGCQISDDLEVSNMQVMCL